MERAEHALLQPPVEVDQHVAARDQVEPREGRVLEQVVVREQDRLAQLVGDAVAARFLAEKALEPLGRHVSLDGARIEAHPRDGERLVVDVGGEDLDLRRVRERVERLADQHRDRIGFLARRAARYPDPDRRVSVGVGDQFGQVVIGERVVRFGVAEEVGDRDQEVLDEGVGFFAVGAHALEIVGKPVDAQHLHPTAHPAADRRALVVREVIARPRAELDEEAVEHFGLLISVRERRLQRNVAHAVGQRDQVAGQFPRCAGEVDVARAQGRARHRLELCRRRLLGHREATSLLDAHQPVGAVRSHAREHDGDGAVVLRFGERAEEVVDQRAPLHARRLTQRQMTVDGAHDAARRDHVDASGLDARRVGHLLHVQVRGALEQGGQFARVVGREVLQHDERQLGVTRNGGEELEKRVQPARRCTHAHYELRPGSFIRGLDVFVLCFHVLAMC